MFVNDGQFGFSLFRYLAKGMAAAFGLAIAAKTLAFLGVLLSAAAFFARQFVSGGAVWAVLIFVCFLPASYWCALSVQLCRTARHSAPFRRGVCPSCPRGPCSRIRHGCDVVHHG